MERIVVYGAGAVGGVIGSRLFVSGRDVVLIARGAHREAIARDGLRVESATGTQVTPVPVVGAPAEISWGGRELVLLTMKGQDTAAALDALEAAAPATIAIGCAQNGIDNERLALRRFATVYSIVVQLPATHLEPGVVVEHSAPVPGSLDLGRYPDGVDAGARELAAILREAGFSAQARADISRWKYSKLLRNLNNSVQALFGTVDGAAEIRDRVLAEARAVLDAAGIDRVGDDEYDARHDSLITIAAVPGRPHGGGSSWQSLARGSGSIEANELNGEIVLLGRLHGVPTPVNDALRREALAAARSASPPGGRDQASFLAALPDA
ncbi:MAG TPA: 2-dehydropantoate 2-reductase N-terminal domain-containing protein [Solirubrobacteraceae bacterium]|nr:2-dehydropantoate 2-reductase N-terminal domain-containing protein [Solirubrobacteraceae bacterium]